LSVVFFTDRDLGLQFPAILRDAGIHVERHADLTKNPRASGRVELWYPKPTR